MVFSRDIRNHFLFFTLQSGSEFTVTPAFSVVTREVTQDKQQHFAMYDVKQLSKLKLIV